ncbi:MAG TPA: sugar transferase [Gammaproteobacteria bacterium]|nr:sugar transferase [Gammaproteobacteria bacterium]
MERAVKRIFEVVLVLATLPLSLPIMGLVATWILLEGSGPVIHRQTREGQGGRAFLIHKFRTLTDDSGGKPTVAPEGDPRITRSGRFLRKWRIDELPQIFDVLRGEMNLVGPRPELPVHLKEIPATIRKKVYSVRPGITGPAAIAFLAEDEFLATVPEPAMVYCRILLPEKLRLELEYVEHWTFTTDLKIIVQTALQIFSAGARRRSRLMIEQMGAAQREPGPKR